MADQQSGSISGSTGPGSGEGLRSWQDRILTTVMTLVVALGLPALIMVTGYLWQKGLFFQLALGWIGYPVALFSLIFRRRLPYTFKALLCLLFMLAIGLSLVWLLGPWSGGLIWLTGFGVMSSLLFGLLGTGLALAVNAVAFTVIGWLIHAGLVSWAAGQPAALEAWLVMVVNFLFVNAVITGSASLMMRGLAQTARLERLAHRELRAQMEERRRAEKARHQSEIRYRSLFEQANDAIIVTDLKDNIVDVNLKACSLLGYTKKELLALTIHDLQAPEYKGPPGQIIERELDNQGRPFEVEDIRKDGVRVPVEITTTPLAGPGQGLALCVVRDISRRKEDEAALRKSEQAHRLLFDSIADIIYTHDLNGNFLSVNPAARRVLDLNPETVAGRPVKEFLDDDNREYFKTEYLPGITSQGRFDGVAKLKTARGELKYIEFRSILVTTEAAEAFVHGVGRDITDRVKTRREVTELQAQLNQAHKMEAVGTLASGIAHDFNNLLQAIIGNTQLLLSSLAGDSQASDRLAEIEGAGGRAAQLVRRLMTFSRRISPDLKAVDLNTVVRDAAGLLRRTIPKMIDIDLALSIDPAGVKADPVQLEQVVMNLATNARDAMPEGGSLSLTTAVVDLNEAFCRTRPGLEPGRYVRLRAADTGQGMDAETLEHLFEPFYTTKETGRGTGLGLSTVYGIIKAHGGHIAVTSRPGRGSTFEIHLPFTDKRITARTKTRPVESASSGGGQTVLVVDDEAAIREVARQALEKAGFRVETAANGEEGLASYRAGGIDLVLLDLGMPGMGGRRCLAEMLTFDPQAKVIVASGYLSGETLKDIPTGQAALVLDKPYRLSEMITKVRQVLKRG